MSENESGQKHGITRRTLLKGAGALVIATALGAFGKVGYDAFVHTPEQDFNADLEKRLQAGERVQYLNATIHLLEGSESRSSPYSEEKDPPIGRVLRKIKENEAFIIEKPLLVRVKLPGKEPDTFGALIVDGKWNFFRFDEPEGLIKIIPLNNREYQGDLKPYVRNLENYTFSRGENSLDFQLPDAEKPLVLGQHALVTQPK